MFLPFSAKVMCTSIHRGHRISRTGSKNLFEKIDKKLIGSKRVGRGVMCSEVHCRVSAFQLHLIPPAQLHLQIKPTTAPAPAPAPDSPPVYS